MDSEVATHLKVSETRQWQASDLLVSCVRDWAMQNGWQGLWRNAQIQAALPPPLTERFLQAFDTAVQASAPIPFASDYQRLLWHSPVCESRGELRWKYAQSADPKSGNSPVLQVHAP